MLLWQISGLKWHKCILLYTYESCKSKFKVRVRLHSFWNPLRRICFLAFFSSQRPPVFLNFWPFPLITLISCFWSRGFPEEAGASLVAQSKASACIAGDPGLICGAGRSPGEGNGTPVLLPGESHGWRSLVGYSPWGLKESGMTEQLHFSEAESGLCTWHWTKPQRQNFEWSREE